MSHLLSIMKHACAPDFSGFPAYRMPLYVAELDATVFTDTKLLLALPGNPLCLAGHECKPGMLQVLWQLHNSHANSPATTPLDASALPAPTLFRSHCCEGGRILKASCPDCAGSGGFVFGHCKYRCNWCGGTGRVHTTDLTADGASHEHCRECDGMGEIEHAFHWQSAGEGMYLDARRLRIAAALPGACVDFHPGFSFAMIAADGGIWGALGRMV